MSKEAGPRCGKSVKRAGQIQRYRRQTGDPVFRPLQVYSTDPADSELDGTRVAVNVPYEELAPGPVGSLFEVVGLSKPPGAKQADSLVIQSPIDLNDPRLLITAGLSPSSSAHFQMQMTYAVAMTTYEAFRRALGRDLHWGFDTPDGEPARLKIYPFYEESENALYDREAHAVKFGWYRSSGQVRGRNIRKGKVFTSLSHDVIAHEVSHALLDGLRPSFLKPLHPDTLAFHEAFSDLVAIFQHFSHPELLKKAMHQAKGNLAQSHLLTAIAKQFGQTKSNASFALRSAVDISECDEHQNCKVRNPTKYNSGDEPHKLGSVLVSAVFEAFTTVFDRKVRKYIKIATGGSGVLPDGDLEQSLADVLAKEASELASQFLSICIRAIDYCPPVAVTFSDYLRAVITADYDLVPNDPYGYRESLVDAFIKRDIPIDGVETVSETALLWEKINDEVDESMLSIIRKQAYELDALTTSQNKYEERALRVDAYLRQTLQEQPRYFEQLGLMAKSDDVSCKDISAPLVESARISRRISPDGQLEIDLVVEIVQSLTIKHEGYFLPAIQGSTVIIDTRGKIRYIIKKEAKKYLERLQDDEPTMFGLYHGKKSGQWHERSELLAMIHKNRDQD